MSRILVAIQKLAKQELKEQQQGELDNKNLAISQKNLKIVFYTLIVTIITTVISTLISLFKD